MHANDANLIASAPDLLEALERLVRIIKAEDPEIFPRGLNITRPDVMEQCDKAIDKAKGICLCSAKKNI